MDIEERERIRIRHVSVRLLIFLKGFFGPLQGAQDGKGVAGVFYRAFEEMKKLSLVMNWKEVGWDELGVYDLYLEDRERGMVENIKGTIERERWKIVVDVWRLVGLIQFLKALRDIGGFAEE